MSKDITLNREQASILILSIGVVVAYGSESIEDDWPLLITLISRIRNEVAKSEIVCEDTLKVEFNEKEIEWLLSAAYYGICYYTLFNHEDACDLVGLGKQLVEASDDPYKEALTEQIAEYLSTR